jgi:peptide/nickel transport system substrate-binding protein
MSDAATRVVALESGQIDVITAVNEDDVDRLKKTQDLTVSTNSTLRSFSVMFTTSIAPINDRAVREAIAASIDMKGLVQALLKNAQTAADRVGFAPGSIGVSKNVPSYKYDLEKAKQTLDAAGWKVGAGGIREKDGKKLKFDLWTTNGVAPKDNLIAESVTQTLRTIGMDVTTQTLEFAAYREKLTKKELPVYTISAGTPTGDIDFLAGLFWQPPSAWVTGVTPEIASLVGAAQTELNPQAREKVYDQVFTAIHKEVLQVPIYFMNGIYATRNSVKGFKVAPTEIFRLADVTKG